ncbi:hypothetical protein ES708_33940 [subsurface metagenome]
MNIPVEQVSWQDAVKFCNKLSDTAGFDRCYNESTWECDFSKNGFRLPTEAEWEYACRAGTETMFYTGNTEDDLHRAGWRPENTSTPDTHEVGIKEPNVWGLYDTHGNVAEWCNDYYGLYNSSNQTNPIGRKSGNVVYRGGSWFNGPMNSRSAKRRHTRPSSSFLAIGFRTYTDCRHGRHIPIPLLSGGQIHNIQQRLSIRTK